MQSAASGAGIVIVSQMQKLSDSLEILLEANVYLEVLEPEQWELTLWDPGAGGSSRASTDGQERELGSVAVEVPHGVGGQSGGQRLYPFQLFLDARYGEHDSRCTSHWSYDLTQPSQLRWRTHPEAIADFIVTQMAALDGTREEIEVGALFVPRLDRTLRIDVSHGCFLIDPHRAL